MKTLSVDYSSPCGVQNSYVQAQRTLAGPWIGQCIPLGIGNLENRTDVYFFGEGTPLQLRAFHEDNGCAFLFWGGDLGGSEGLLEFTLDMDMAATAVFNDAVSVTTNAIGNGIIGVTRVDGGPVESGGTGIYVVPVGRAIEVAPIPDSAWFFYRWFGDTITTENERLDPIEFVIEENAEFTVRFMPEIHSADFVNADEENEFTITLSNELMRIISHYNSNGFHCREFPGQSSEDGYIPGFDDKFQDCAPHSGDYYNEDYNWRFNLAELLRHIQFYNFNAVLDELSYHSCPGAMTEDGYCPGSPE